VILPDMRGPQLVEVARAVHPESAVLFASGYSTDSIGRRGELPAAVDLIEKPYSPTSCCARPGGHRSERTRPRLKRPTFAGGPTDPTAAVRSAAAKVQAAG
jgi:hypothetical protein